MPVSIVTREEWGARPAKEGIEDVSLPIRNVLFTMEQGHTPVCKTKEDCIKSVRGLQEYFMVEKELQDIPYNFIIGNCGNVYEGRGWKKKPRKSYWDEKYADNTMDIAIITGHVNEHYNTRVPLEHEPFDLLVKFVKEHVDGFTIGKDYIVSGFSGGTYQEAM